VMKGKKYQIENRDKVKQAKAIWYQHAGADREKGKRKHARAEHPKLAGKILANNVDDVKTAAVEAKMRQKDNAAQQRSGPSKRVQSEHSKANIRRQYKENTDNIERKRELTVARHILSGKIQKKGSLAIFVSRIKAQRLTGRAVYAKAMRLMEKKRAQAMRVQAEAQILRPEIIALSRNRDIAEWLMDDITKYNEHRKSIRADDMFWPYDLPWAQTMGHFAHPCLLMHHVHGLGLAQMLHAQNLGHCQFDIFTPLPSAKKYPAMKAGTWKPYKQFAPRNPYPVSCAALARPQSTHSEFAAVSSRTDARPGVAGTATFVSQVLAAYEFRGVAPADPRTMDSISLFQYIMRYETVDLIGSAGDTIPFDQGHPDRFVATFCVQSLRSVPLTVQAAWALVETSLGPAPCFPPEISSVTEDWVRGACDFGKYFLAVFRPWHQQPIDPTDPWGELVCFLRFIGNTSSYQELKASLAFLAAHPLKYSPFQVIPEEVGPAEDQMDVSSDSDDDEPEPESKQAGIKPFVFMDPDHEEENITTIRDAGKKTEATPRASDQKMRIRRSLEDVAARLGVSLPAGFVLMRETMALINEVLKLMKAPEGCLAQLMHQAQWSRTMLVDSFVHLPRILQREVAKRLHDPDTPFETGCHALNKAYGVRVELDLLLNGSDPMDLGALNSLMDTEDEVCNQILAQHDRIVSVAAIYLHLTACTNSALEERVFRIESDRKVMW